jgi:serine phosphatase RsbU (regulator of sigma subunit)
MPSSRWAGFWRDRRTLWLLLVALALLAGAALWILADYQRLAADVTMEADQRMTQLAAVRIRDELAQFPDALAALARNAGILSQDPARQADALQRSDPFREGLFDAGIVVLDNFGVVAATAPPRPELLQQDWSDSPYFRDLLDGSPASVVFSDAVGEGPAGSQVIAVSVPLFDGEGRFTGALAGLLRLSQSTISPYYATLVKLRVSPDGTVYLLDGSHRILFDSASLRDGEQYDDHALPSGRAETVRTRDALGRDLLLSSAPIPGTPWTLVIEREWGSLPTPTGMHTNLLLVLLGLGTVLPLAALGVLLRQERRQPASDISLVSESHLARHLQQALLSEAPPLLPGWSIAVHRERAPAPGRIFYDFLLGADGCLRLICAETRRLPAGSDGASDMLAMITARTLLRSAARAMLEPAAAIQRTNTLLWPELPPGSSIACLYCRFDPASGAVAIGVADHVQPLKLSGEACELIGGKDPPLGLQLDEIYDEHTTVLAESDCLFLCSSEVLHACNAEGEEFGRKRLELAVAAPDATAAQRIEAVTAAVRQFAGGNWANDRDAILIAVERLPGGLGQAQL